MAEVEYWAKEGWQPKDTDDFWNNYLSKHLKYINVEEQLSGTRKQKIVYFADGSAVKIDIYFAENDDGEITMSTHGGHFLFCPEAKYCKEKALYTSSSYGCNTSKSSKKMYCAAVIQHNGWKIPKDYPIKL